MTIDTEVMELIGVFLSYLRFVNYNVSCSEGDWGERKYLIITKEWIISQITD